jgi:hypothetical protein
MHASMQAVEELRAAWDAGPSPSQLAGDVVGVKAELSETAEAARKVGGWVDGSICQAFWFCMALTRSPTIHIHMPVPPCCGACLSFRLSFQHPSMHPIHTHTHPRARHRPLARWRCWEGASMTASVKRRCSSRGSSRCVAVSNRWHIKIDVEESAWFVPLRMIS